MADNSTLAEVAVAVSADLTQLERDFAKAKQQAQAHNRDMERLTAAQWADKNRARLEANAKTSSATARQQIEASRRLTQQYQAEAKANEKLTDQVRRHTDAMRNELLLTNRLDRARSNRPARSAGSGGGPPIIVPPLRETERGLLGVGRAASTATLFMQGFIGAIGVDTAFRLAGATVEILKTTAAIDDMAKAVGMSSTEFQEWRGIGSMLGIEAEKMETAMGEFAENVRQAAAGADREEKVFSKLGVSLKDAAGNARPINEVLLQTIDRLGQVGNAHQRGAALAMLFGEAVGPEMAKAVDAGVNTIDELRKAVHETGMVLSEDQIQKADQTARKLEQVKNVLNVKIAGVVVDNADAIGTLADALANIVGVALQAASALASFYSQAGKPIPVPRTAGGMFGLAAGAALNPLALPVHALRSLAGGNRGTQATGLNQAGSSVTVSLPASKPKGGGIDLSGLFDRKSGGRRGGGRGRSAPDNIFEREEVQAQQERLRLLRSATVDLERRNQIDRELIDLQLRERLIQIEKQRKDGRLNAAQAKQLAAAEEANAQLEREAADRQMRSDQIEQQARNAQELLDAEDQMLSVSLRLARTDRERTRIEAAILANKQTQERLEIDKSISLAREVDDQKEVERLMDLRAKMLSRQGSESKAFAVEQLRGIEKFRNELPKTVDEINEQIEKIRFEVFTEKLQEAARFAEDVGDAFGRAAGRIANFENPLSVLQGLLQDLSQTLTEQFIVGPASDWATKNIGGPLAKKTIGKDLTGPDALSVQQMNMAIDLATGNLHNLALAATQASAAMGGGTGGGVGAAGAADALSQAATGTEQSFASLDPQLSQFGNGLMQIISGVAGGGGGGGLMGFLQMGLSLAGAAAGGGGGLLAGGGLSALSAAPGVNWVSGAGAGDLMLGAMADGGWVGGHGTGRSDSNLIWASVGEHMTNARAARAFGPVLDGINSGMIPSMPALRKMMGSSTIDRRSYHFGDFMFPGIRDAREARQAERHMTSTLQRELGRASRAGYRDSK